MDIGIERDRNDFEDLLAGFDMFPESSQRSVSAPSAFDVPPVRHSDRPDDHVPLIPMSVQPVQMHSSHAVSNVINKVEAIFESITDSLLNEQDEVSIKLKIRGSRVRIRARDDLSEYPTKKLSFPGRGADEAWRFTVVLRILSFIHEALRNDVLMSKRDIYYRDPALFGSQAPVDRYVDDIAFTFGVPRSSLNITAAAKGLVAGAVVFYRQDGSIVNVADERKGFLVPNLKDIRSVDLSVVKWILVVEKEASFQTIVASRALDKFAAKGVIMTGKGYPDLSTRVLLHFLSCPSVGNGFASPPVYGLADFDPDGIAILLTYKRGSISLAHESATHCVPQLRPLGLHNEHLRITNHSPNAARGVLTLSARDRRKALSLLGRIKSSACNQQSTIATELQSMLMLNSKAELQILDGSPNGISDMLAPTLGALM